jgi:hypothetical protein
MGTRAAPTAEDGGAARRFAVERLARLVESIEGREGGARHGDGSALDAVPTGWPSLDGETGGLPRGVLHEWSGVGEPEGVATEGAASRAPAPPPLLVLLHLAERALRGETSPRGWVFWVGRRVWPHPRALVRDPDDALPANLDVALPLGPADPRALLERSVLVDPPDDATRLWAIDLVLRCPSARCVVADGRRLSMSASRRLQLAAAAGGALALLARPPSEADAPSIAATRFAVARAASEDADEGASPRFRVERRRWKPARVATAGAGSGSALLSRAFPPLAFPSLAFTPLAFTLEWDDAACAVVEPSPVRGGPGAEVSAPDRLRPAV